MVDGVQFFYSLFFFLILIIYIVKVHIYLDTKGIFAEQKSSGF